MSPTKALPGSCSICGAELKKASAAKHLAACLAATPGTTEYVIVKVVGAGLGDVDYWLFAAVPADASLKDLSDPQTPEPLHSPVWHGNCAGHERQLLRINCLFR